MARLEDLIKDIADPRLREQIGGEVSKLKAKKKFGLVFEEHLPEVVQLPGLAVKPGARVGKRAEKAAVLYMVTDAVNGKKVRIVPERGGPEEVAAKDDLVVVKRFGEPMYPALVPVDRVTRAPGKPYHTLINADNFHALQVLLYCYEGQVDVIYIDPPYNSGARDWKYNNDYVDGNDNWRHSKWLSYMQRRLLLAQRLLHPTRGVLIITIDEHELHHLGMLLEGMFPEWYRQMVTIVINPKGVTQGRFSRVEEYALFCFGPAAFVTGKGDDLLSPEPEEQGILFPRWKGLLRSGTNARREDRENLFYPVLIDSKRGAVVGTGEPLPMPRKPELGKKIQGFDAAWPVRTDGSLGNWGVGHTTLRTLIKRGYVSVGQWDDKRKTFGLTYLSKKLQNEIASGILDVVEFDKNRNVVELRYTQIEARQIKAVWHRTTHDAGAYGSDMLRELLGKSRSFSFPKSLYAVRDSLAALTRDRPNALIVDFFAGSGTTLHATALLNAEDGGSRVCILATNNEVSERIAKELTEKGIEPGTEQWEAEGICEAVTWPRVRACIAGKRLDGTPLPGEYLDDRAMADGFEENAQYLKLDFLDPAEVKRGDTYEAILPILWMMAGASGDLELAKGGGKHHFPKGCPFCVLLNEAHFADFAPKLAERKDITHVFLVTNSVETFHEMAARVGKGRRCIQLYKSYLDNFKINLEPKHAD